MKAIRVIKPGQFKLVESSIPELGLDEVLVRVSACGLCSTDLEILSGNFWGSYPLVPGHEIAGTVERTGGNATGTAVGDRVAVNPNIPCGYCQYCRKGMPHLCEHLEAIGVTRGGGFAEYVAVPSTNVYSLPEHVSSLVGALAEPLACVLHGVDRARPQEDDSVTVFGAGFIGLLFSMCLQRSGVRRLLLVDPSSRRRKLAEERGFSTIHPDRLANELGRQGVLPTISVDCTGSVDAMETGLRHIARGGRVLLFGVTKPTDVLRLFPYEVFRREITVLGSFVNPFTMQRAVRLLEELDVGWLINNEFSLEEFGEAIDAKRQNALIIKAVGVPT